MRKQDVRTFVLCLVGLFVSATLSAGKYYFYVQFSDKEGNDFSLASPRAYLSDKAISRRATMGLPIDSTDLPVNTTYITALQTLGCNIKQTSKWLNGVTVILSDSSVMQHVRRLPFVTYTQLTKTEQEFWLPSRIVSKQDELGDSEYYGVASRQIEMLKLNMLHKIGYTGKGVEIAVIDAGFSNADYLVAFDSVRHSGRMLGSRDFVDPTSDIFREDSHGMYVLSILTGNIPNRYVGSAPGASYYLLRTEDVGSESLLEVDNWVAAVEYADSLGVDIITSSLGYSEFDDASQDFTYADMNGKVARNSRVAAMASSKGLLLINSAGNEGAKSWKYITAPADADHIITVGSVGADGLYSPFSSIGPTSDGRVKPDVVAMGGGTAIVVDNINLTYGNGTSFSTPIIAGMFACLREALPQLSSEELMTLVKNYSTHTHTPNAYYGYGIPNAWAIYRTIVTTDLPIATEREALFQYDASRKCLLIAQGVGSCTVQLFDLAGRLLMEQTSSSSSREVSLNNCTPGVVIVSVISDAKRVTSKLIIQ